MKLIIIPPYRAQNYTPTKGHYMVSEVIEDMKEKGQLEGVEIDIDAGHPIENTTDTTGQREGAVSAFRAIDELGAGVLKRVKMFCEGDKYDAIVTSGGLDAGFTAARMISKIPVAAALNSAVHLASLIGDRFAIVHLDDPTAALVKRAVQAYGLDHMLASVRSMGHSSPSTMAVIGKTKHGQRYKTPEGKNFIDDILAQCITAIEEDRADSLIFGTPAMQCLQDEVRQRLDEAGYGEIPLISGLRAAIEMAKAMVTLKLMQTARAYPSDALKAKPKFR